MAETDKSHVHLGRYGWLFLIGGSNRVMDRYRGPLAQWWHLRRWSRLIAARAARAERLGIRYLHVIVPEKLSVYDHLTDGLRYMPGHSSARQLAKRLGRSATYLDLLAPLRAARDGASPLYLRTDSHWSLEGCLVAYRAIMRALSATPPADTSVVRSGSFGMRYRFMRALHVRGGVGCSGARCGGGCGGVGDEVIWRRG